MKRILLLSVVFIPILLKAQGFRDDSTILYSAGNAIRFITPSWYEMGQVADSLIQRNSTTLKRELLSPYDLPVSNAVVANYYDKTTSDARYFLASNTTSNLTEGSNLYFTNARARGAFSAGTGIAIDGSGVISSTVAAFSGTTDTLSAVRSFNTAYQPSTTKYTYVSVCGSISPTISLTSGQSGEIYLELSANGSTNWVQHGKIVNGNSGTLTIGLNLTELGGSCMSTWISPTVYWRLRTNSVTGAPTYTMLQGSKFTVN